MSRGVGVIAYGPAKGLKIDSTLGFPGYQLGTTEPDQQQWLVKNLASGDVVYEIGANVGFFALLCARLVGKDGWVYALEPHPDCANACRTNLAINGFENASVHELAVSDTDGVVELNVSQTSTALARVRREGSGDDLANIQVASARLDTLAKTEGFRAPTVLMIDVEGHEIEVLRGCHNLIQRHKPSILCEVHWLGKGFTDYFQDELAPLGYQISNLEGGPAIETPDRWHTVLTPLPATSN